jgi:hypothetical protein
MSLSTLLLILLLSLSFLGVFRRRKRRARAVERLVSQRMPELRRDAF